MNYHLQLNIMTFIEHIWKIHTCTYVCVCARTHIHTYMYLYIFIDMYWQLHWDFFEMSEENGKQGLIKWMYRWLSDSNGCLVSQPSSLIPVFCVLLLRQIPTQGRLLLLNSPQ